MVELRIDRNCWYSPPSFPWLIRIPDRCLHNGTSFFLFTLKELVHSFFRDISGCIILLAPEKCAWLATRHIPKTIAGGNTFEHLKSTTACPTCLKQWENTLIFREILKKMLETEKLYVSSSNYESFAPSSGFHQLAIPTPHMNLINACFYGWHHVWWHNQNPLTHSLPCSSVQIKNKSCKNMNSVQQNRGHAQPLESTHWELSFEWSHL